MGAVALCHPNPDPLYQMPDSKREQVRSLPAASLLAAIVESSDDAIISKDLNGIITTWNKAAERIFGYTAAEAVGQSILILIPPDRAREESEILARIRKGERVDHFITVRRRKDGQLINISVTVSPVKDSAGNIIGASKVARDITEQERATEQLRIAEERFRVTLSSIGDAVVATDLHSRVTFINPVAAELTGWPEAEAIGKPLTVVFHIINEMSRRPADNPVAKVLRHGKIVGLANHTALIARDGVEYSIADSAAPIRDSAGQTSGVVLVFRDVGESRRTEIALARLAAIVENSDDAIISKDLHGIITSWNKAAERIFGYTAQEAVGKLVTILMPPDRQDEEQDILGRIHRGDVVDHFETVRITKNGRLLNVSVTISPIRDSSGEIIGASKIARPIHRP
jgi:PAS domain S-box-containing protein